MAGIYGLIGAAVTGITPQNMTAVTIPRHRAPALTNQS
jgi:hypothetical protein